MAERLRRGSVVALMMLVGFALPAQGEEFSSCWTAMVQNGWTGIETPVTRCRIVGGDTVNYASDNEIPDVLYPNMGTDITGQCWYLTSATTAYVVITRYADGSAEMGYDTDPGNPGSIIAVGPVVPRCTSEPAPETDPSRDAWDYVMSYIHPPPAPDLNPSAGDGITGLPTFVGVTVPPDHDATLASGLSTLDVEIDVDAVVVSWGDGNVDTYPPMDTILAGYPDGAATHVYEVKTVDDSPITVSYDWTARWRVDGGAWNTLVVPDTSTSTVYPVAEVVSKLTD